MLTYDLSLRGHTSLYEYLYRCIREDILSGDLRSGERLPSKRQLAAHLQVSVITVEAAYAQLEAEGYLRAVEKRGYFVEPVQLQARAQSAPPPTAEETPPAWWMDLSSNNLRNEDFPFSAWARLVRTVLLDEGQRLMEPVPCNGVLALRRAIAGYLHRFRGMTVDPARIVVGAGTEYLYGLLVQLIGRDRIFALEDPGYPKIGGIYRLNGVQCRYLPVDGQGLSVEPLYKSDAAVAHLSPSHHFPSGVVMPIGRRQALLKWAEEGGRYLIEDDYDSEFRMSGRPLPTLASIDRSGRVVYVNTFSKSLAPSLRIAYMVLPAELSERYRQSLRLYACTVPSAEQYVLARFLDSGAFEQHLARMKTVYRSRRDAVIDAVCRSRFGNAVTIRESDAGLHFLLQLHGDRTAEEVASLAATAGIRLSCLSEYCREMVGENAVIINYSGVDPTQLDEAVRRMERVLYGG